MTAPRRSRVAILNSHPIQYFAPLYRHINRSDDIEIVPIYLTDFSLRGQVDEGFGRKVVWDIDLLEGTQPIFVPGYATRAMNPGATRMWAPAIWDVIRRGRFDALILHGHNLGAAHIALLAAKASGALLFQRAETHLGLPASGPRRALRRLVLDAYYRLFDGMLAIGARNRQFYRAMGVPASKIFDCPYTVDNQRLMAASRLDPAERSAIRAGHGLRSGVATIVYASKLMRRKHPDDLLEAAIRLRREGFDFDLLFAGSGEMEDELRNRAADLPGAPARFTGFVNQLEMPRVLAACDIFALPAEAEPWGLVINEAMCAGLPIVASREIGAVPDLVHHAINGRLFDATDVGGLADALRPLIVDGEARAAMGGESLRIISEWNYERCLEGMRSALAAAGRH